MKWTAIIAITLTVVSIGQASEKTRRQLSYAPGPVDNPLKGFVPFRGEYRKQFPHSMEWVYLPLNQLMKGRNQFDFDGEFEKALGDVASRGHHVVMRIYLDYPRKKTGVPKFLIDAGLKMTRYTDFGGGLSPDYQDRKLYDALESFLAAFGQRYDGDPRIGFITIGLLGFWGEWHTYPHEDWFPSTENQNRVLHAYTKAFRKTKLLMRQPMADGPKLPIGYHDDSFAFSTLPDVGWHFLSQMKRQGTLSAWKLNSIGGELRPELQATIWKPSSTKIRDTFEQCVQLTHCSWLLNQHLFSYRRDGNERELATKAARSLGYELHVSQFEYAVSNSDQTLTGSVKIENRGVAPFPYDWPVELRVVDARKTSKTFRTNWQISGILPGEPQELQFSVSLKQPIRGSEQLELHVPNPLKNAKAVQFANIETTANGGVSLGRIKP